MKKEHKVLASYSKTKTINSYNVLQIKFSDCAFKTKKKKINSALKKIKQTLPQRNPKNQTTIKWHFF